VEYYDKKHLFTMSGEDRHYTAGNRKLVVNYKGWRICPLICYDLRFPVWSRNREEYDLLIYMANWPSSRQKAWKALLPARAVENQSWCIGVNRVGMDGAGLTYDGDSALIDPKGHAEFFGNRDQLRIFEISFQELMDFRKKFPVLKDRDEFKLI
jgi:predicted amidohydrolase